MSIRVDTYDVARVTRKLRAESRPEFQGASAGLKKQGKTYSKGTDPEGNYYLPGISPDDSRILIAGRVLRYGIRKLLAVSRAVTGILITGLPLYLSNSRTAN